MHIHTSEGEVLSLGIGPYTCNWGTHICGLYATNEERDRMLAGYLHAGGKAHDRQIYIHSEQTAATFTQMLAGHCLSCAALLTRRNEIDIKDSSELYYPNGTFDPWQMDEIVNAYYAHCQEEGPANLRAIAEMAWALKLIPGVEHLFAYEARLNYFVKERRVISVCLYNINKISGRMLMGVLETHPFTITGNTITQNPYFVQPDKWLKENAPQFL